MSAYPFGAGSLDGLQDTGGDPAQHYLLTAPPFDVALDQPGAADETLDRVGRGQRAAETW